MRPNQYQPAFTLIEMILVIVILGLLMTIGSSLFVVTDDSSYYAETCANYIYGEIKNHQYAALVGKKLDLSKTIVEYNILFDIPKNSIIIGYTTDDGQTSEQKIDLVQADPQRLCASDSYNIILSGSFNSLNLSMNKNFSQHNSKAPVVLEETTDSGTHSVATGAITIIQKSLTDNSNKDISQIHIDTRNQNITLHRCHIFNRRTSRCTKRQQ